LSKQILMIKTRRLVMLMFLVSFSCGRQENSSLPQVQEQTAENKDSVVELSKENNVVLSTAPSIAPVNTKKAEFGDGYGKRIHPVTKQRKMHNGVDFVLSEGDSVVATADGVVIDVGYDKLKGTYITLKHNDSYTTSYSHLKNALVKVQDVVKQNQLLAYIGPAGEAPRPHVHYEVLKDGLNVNPVDYLPGSIAAEFRP